LVAPKFSPASNIATPPVAGTFKTELAPLNVTTGASNVNTAEPVKALPICTATRVFATVDAWVTQTSTVLVDQLAVVHSVGESTTEGV
jgi:hypothetical protein